MEAKVKSLAEQEALWDARDVAAYLREARFCQNMAKLCAVRGFPVLSRAYEQLRHVAELAAKQEQDNRIAPAGPRRGQEL